MTVPEKLHDDATRIRAEIGFYHDRELARRHADALDLIADGQEFIAAAHEHSPALRPMPDCWPCTLLARIEEFTR